MSRMAMDTPVFAQHDRLAAAVQHGLRQTAARLVGPGGYYNIGNAVGLAMGIRLQIGSAPSEGTGIAAAADAALIYLGGNTPAMALTLATAVFFGAARSITAPGQTDRPRTRPSTAAGDLLSGVGALILFVALLSLGHVMLAATAGLLHALGKFGSGWKLAADARLAPDLALLLPHRGAGEPRSSLPRDDDRPRVCGYDLGTRNAVERHVSCC